MPYNPPPELVDLDRFLSTSAKLNYLLSAKEPSFEAIARTVLEKKIIAGSINAIKDSVAFLVRAYSNRSRRLGPMAVLHPLRTAHTFVIANNGKLNEIDIMTAFLHDYYEDIYTLDLNESVRRDLEWQYKEVLKHLVPDERSMLDERIKLLTIEKGEKYHQYLGRLMNEAERIPELLWVKMADRLDNTFDMRIVENEDCDFFRMLFDLIFLNETPEHSFVYNSPPAGQMSESKRLYQMFKNAVFLTLIRNHNLDGATETSRRLFMALGIASLKESGRILSDIFRYYIRDIDKRRELVFDTISYNMGGGLNQITHSGRGNRLDGLFKERFDQPDRQTRKKVLNELQQDKDMMALAALAFISLFESFLASPGFVLQGVQETGLSIVSNNR